MTEARNRREDVQGSNACASQLHTFKLQTSPWRVFANVTAAFVWKEALNQRKPLHLKIDAKQNNLYGP